MSVQVELVYFLGCPKAAIAFSVLKDNCIPFGLVIQDRLSKDDPKRMLSSPSVLVNGVQVIGETISGGLAACTYSALTAESIVRAVREACNATDWPQRGVLK